MGVFAPQSLKAAVENSKVPCVTTRPLCHNPLLPPKANKRLGPLCSSPHWWPHTKCDSRDRSRSLCPGKATKRKHWQWRAVSPSASVGKMLCRLAEGSGTWHGRARGRGGG